MVRRWDQWKNPWDREYAKRGRLWRGATSLDPLPAFAPRPGPVLEVGCGDGKFLSALAAFGYRWIGADFSRYALKFAREDAKGTCVLSDARKLPFKDRSMPIVVARYVLGAFRSEGRTRVAMECARVLRPDGVLLIEDFSSEDFRSGKGTLVEPGTFERNEGILSHYFSRDELLALFPGMRVLAFDVLRHKMKVEGTLHERVALRALLSPSSAKSLREVGA
jgi:ubiquinone/menaquinone biosynthesis C-methylase UbiE